jgi:hypothetical protein
MAEAACAQSTPEAFFPDGESERAYQAAKEICASCRVKRDCLAYVLSIEIGGFRHGCWGGTSPRDRRIMMRRRPRHDPDNYVEREQAHRFAHPEWYDEIDAPKILSA